MQEFTKPRKAGRTYTAGLGLTRPNISSKVRTFEGNQQKMKAPDMIVPVMADFFSLPKTGFCTNVEFLATPGGLSSFVTPSPTGAETVLH